MYVFTHILTCVKNGSINDAMPYASEHDARLSLAESNRNCDGEHVITRKQIEVTMPKTSVVINRFIDGNTAFDVLRDMFSDASTYKVSIDIRGNDIAAKRNEDMWWPTLDCG